QYKGSRLSALQHLIVNLRGLLQALILALRLLSLDDPSFQASKCSSSNQAPADSLKPPWTHWPDLQLQFIAQFKGSD
ncbi:hypothetical protein AMECASPLE_038456, partial [Ameca splendens]